MANLAQSVDPDGRRTKRTFDALHRLTSENDLAVAGVEIAYTYDTCASGVGRLCQAAVNGDVVSDLEYGLDGQATTEIRSIYDISFTRQTAYDRQGNITSRLYPDLSLVEYSYDEAGLLSSVSWTDGRTGATATIITDIQHDASGQPQVITFGNGTSTTNTYDPAELYRMRARETVLGATRLQGFTYTYDPAGNVTQIVDATDLYARQTIDYQYDDVHRLTRARAACADPTLRYVMQWEYDELGSMTFSTSSGEHAHESGTPGVFANPHAPTRIGESTFTYDKAGELLSDGIWTHSWNFKGWLAGSESAGDVLEYSYDHGGVRAYKENLVSGDTTLYASDFYEVRDDVTYRHIMAGGLGRIATSIYDETTGTASLIYHHTDHLGSTHVDTDAGGNVVEWVLYYPYGSIQTEYLEGGSRSNPFKYTGKEIDDVTFLTYYGARYLATGSGVFTSQDPVFQKLGDVPDAEARQQLMLVLTDPQLGNSYAYARGNPIRYTDPDGRFIPILLAAWAVTEFAISAWDAYSTYQTLTDDQASGAQKAAALTGFVAGLSLPGGGYGKGSALLGNRVGRFLQNVRVLDQASGLGRVVYRGGAKFEARIGLDIKLDARGMVTREKGVSLNSSAEWARENFRSAYRIDSIPDGLDIIQTGKDHYSIVPTRSMGLHDYQALLNEIETTEIK